MSGDATVKPHFYNDKVHAGEQTHEKWREMKWVYHRAQTHPYDWCAINHKQNIFNYSKSLHHCEYTGLWTLNK